MNASANNISTSFNDVSKIYNYSAYQAFVERSSKPFKRYQAQLVDNLVSLLQDKNTVCYSKDTWCEYLNTSSKNLIRKLKVALPLIEIETSFNSKDVPRGSLRVNVSPAYGFIGTAEERQQAINYWYSARDLSTLKDVYVSQSLIPYLNV